MARTLVPVKMVVVDVVVVVSQYNKKRPSRTDSVSATPDSMSVNESSSLSLEAYLCKYVKKIVIVYLILWGTMRLASSMNGSVRIFLLFLPLQVVTPVLVLLKHTVTVERDEVVEELDT